MIRIDLDLDLDLNLNLYTVIFTHTLIYSLTLDEACKSGSLMRMIDD